MAGRRRSNPPGLLCFQYHVFLASMAFGLNVTVEQMGMVMLAIEAVLALVTNSTTTPNQQVAVTVNPATGTTAAGPAAGKANTDSAGRMNPTGLMVALLLVPSLTMAACGTRYVPGTPTQTKFAYELKQSLEKLEEVQVKVIAGVDGASITPAAAKPFLDATRKTAQFSRDQLIPKLDAYDAATKLADRARADALSIEIRPLVAEFNVLLGQAFGVQLPNQFANELSKVAEEVRKLLVGIRTRFAPPQAQGA